MMPRAHVACGLALLAAWGAARPSAGAETQAAEPRFYTRGDFAQVEKIDAHVHVHGRADRFMAQAIADRFRILTIDVDYPDYPPIAAQQRDALALRARYPGRVAFATTFSVAGFGSPGWSAGVIADIDAAVAQGAVGVKIWKNIGMALRDADGRYVMPDDARLEPIIAHLESAHLVLLGHQAEPLNCWLPPAKMTVRSDREYFREHPQYYMYRHPEMPGHDVILAARDAMLRAHPALRFDAVHLASLEWDVDRVADFLERFPHARVDVAARLVHLEYQAVSQRDKVRRFLIRYQDRILYGSDEAYGPADDDAAALAELDAGWRADWRFLATSERMHSEDFAGSFRGLQLPRPVIDKIYRGNAQALFPGAWDLTR
ncbi:MAG: amidohydrolase family protein [Gammaproteobacteria bacterium]|nr:amidohydrolase family protein [Gammaproteobacteria bacterium]